MSQVLFQGVPNTHQLKNKEILAICKSQLILKESIVKLDISRSILYLGEYITYDSMRFKIKPITDNVDISKKMIKK